jgi:hypothetical protein
VKSNIIITKKLQLPPSPVCLVATQGSGLEIPLHLHHTKIHYRTHLLRLRPLPVHQHGTVTQHSPLLLHGPPLLPPTHLRIQHRLRLLIQALKTTLETLQARPPIILHMDPRHIGSGLPSVHSGSATYSENNRYPIGNGPISYVPPETAQEGSRSLESGLSSMTLGPSADEGIVQ